MTTALTGTPGVGKTTVAECLKEEGYKVLDLNAFIDEKGLRGERDEIRQSDEVDISELRNHIRNHISKTSVNDIVEGHLSHHLDLSPIIVLRCSPKELRKRMASKDWPQRKIEENIQAEILDVVLIESLEYTEEVYEIDTSEMDPEEVSNAVIKIMNNKVDNYSIGQVDWSDEF
ncbi:MAG: adenylate kinase family protein [Thermoplasmatota archaeon]